MHAKSLQLCLTLCDPIDCSPRGSSFHGIFQARILQWVAMPLSRAFSQPRYGTCISCLLHWQAGSLPPAPPGKPPKAIYLYPYLYHTYTNIHGLGTYINHLSLPLLGKLMEKRDHLNFTWCVRGNQIVFIQFTLTITFYRILGLISEKAMAPHSSTLAWKIPGTEEPGRL